MSTTYRQNRLLLAEDWKRVYQSFRNADFQSYDFDNLRRTMINYLRTNYPEDFNDYIESSEYLALIDLIAFLGQNIAFRVDLNARENYLELAERRESVLRLARLLSYNPKRNQPANGLLKFESVATTEEIFDSNNVNLAGQTVVWNDPANTNWSEQFRKVLNAALPQNGIVGKPVKSDTVNGITVQQYRFNATNADVPVYSFTKTVDGKSTIFEVVSSDIGNGTITEEAPLPGNRLAFLYREDGKGNGSSNTGYFCSFRQGILDQGGFQITNPGSNQVVQLDATNVNDSDVWLYRLDNNGAESQLWTKVDAVEGNNVIYNSVNKRIKNIYSVLSRVEDRVSLIFADGTFGNLPQGNFRVYYRTSQNRSFAIQPDDLIGITVTIPYTSRNGVGETLTIDMELKYTVDNASVSETNESIKNNAPATYYTQNRMVTGEDYQVSPLAVSQEIIKVKSVNRTSSGISRYFDLIDSTGKYSSTNIYGNDGVIYKEDKDDVTSFNFTTRTDVEGIVENTITPLLQNTNINNFYLSKFAKIVTGDIGATWVQSDKSTNNSNGYFKNVNNDALMLGTFTGSSLRYVTPGTLLKFSAPEGKHFMANNSHELMSGTADHPNAVTYKWAKVVSIVTDGTTVTNGVGPVVLNDIIPSDAILTEVRPKLANGLETAVKSQVIDQIFAFNTFGLRFDVSTESWKVIKQENLKTSGAFSQGQTGDESQQSLDGSWLLLFQTDGVNYTLTYRTTRYVFESDKEIKFYYDSTDKIYDSRTGKLIKDKINILSINQKPDSLTSFTTDFLWQVSKEYRDSDNYVNSKKVEVTFYDNDSDGVVDNPDIFEEYVDTNTNPTNKWVFMKKQSTTDQSEIFVYTPSSNITVKQNEGAIGTRSSYTDGTIFYLVDENVFKILNSTTLALSLSTDYKAYRGREYIKFQYVHSADDSNRIDPSSTNIIDTYILTKSYDTKFRRYIAGTLSTKPLAPSTDELFTSYGANINKIKSISDEVIYHPVKYKVLFGDKADLSLQAKFKIVKNTEVVVNDNDLKVKVIQAINQFFALDNWDFGDKFSFTEMATYVMNQTAPNLLTFVIVPVEANKSFGSLYEINSESDEIFISGATVDNVEIIDNITATRLKAEGQVVTSTSTSTGGVSSSAFTSTTSSTTNTSSGTTTYSNSGSSGSGSGGSGSSGSGY